MLHSALTIPLIALAATSLLWGESAVGSVTSEPAVSFDSQGNSPLTQYIFQPDGIVGKDTFITSLTPSENFGTSTDLIVAYLISGYYHYWESLIQFTELDDPQFEGVTVVSAELQLYAYDWCAGTCIIVALTGPWDESTLIWGGRPGYTGYQYVSCYLGHDWLSIDVTDYVQDWLNGSLENNGFLLRQASLLDEFLFYSSDFDSLPELRPRLILNYINPSPLDRNTWTQIKTSL